MARRSHWRDRKEWTASGLPFSTTSDQACKLYDAALTQVSGYYNEPSLGGLEQTLNELMSADPHNIMAHCLCLGLELFGSGQCLPSSPDLLLKVESLNDLASGESVNSWEKRHAKAISLLSAGYMCAASNIWEDITVDYPQDFMALAFAFSSSIFLGKMAERRDSLARVINQWTPKMPNYGYLLGKYAFGLTETNLNQKAEVTAREALAINPLDTWANHSLLHVFDSSCQYQEAIDHLGATVEDWTKGESLACHTYWHWALCNMEKGDFDAALGILDSEMVTRTLKAKSQFGFTDCSSLLFRLEMEGVNVHDRWEDMYELCRPMLDEYQFCYVDPHVTMACLGAKHRDEACGAIEAITAFAKAGNTDGHNVKREVTGDLCRAMVAYSDGDYAAAVDLLQPIRYQVYKIGSSNTQRDVYNQFLIHAALRSSDAHHNNLARSLIFERQQRYDTTSPLTERLMSQLFVTHN